MISIKIHLEKDKDDDFDVKAVGGGSLDDWVDLVTPGGRVELFVPVARSAAVAECFLRAAMELLEQVRNRERKAAEKCPPTVPNS